MTSEEHPPAPDCPTCGDSMKVHPSGWGRWFCMNGHWAGTTDEELRAIRERPGDSPTVSEPRTEAPVGSADGLQHCATCRCFGRAEAAQPIDVERLRTEFE